MDHEIVVKYPMLERFLIVLSSEGISEGCRLTKG
jgi:hypothetical protein